MDSLFKTLSGLLGVIILLAIFIGLPIVIGLCIIGALIVPLTALYGVATDQSYARVCDNSEILYRLNQIGKFTLVIGLALFVFFIILHFIV